MPEGGPFYSFTGYLLAWNKQSKRVYTAVYLRLDCILCRLGVKLHVSYTDEIRIQVLSGVIYCTIVFII